MAGGRVCVDRDAGQAGWESAVVAVLLFLPCQRSVCPYRCKQGVTVPACMMCVVPDADSQLPRRVHCLLLQGVASPERRVELFAAYIEALRQVAAQRIAKAEAAVTQLLVKLNVGPESSWDEVGSMPGRQGCTEKLSAALCRTACNLYKGHGRARPLWPCALCGSVLASVQAAAHCLMAAVGVWRCCRLLPCWQPHQAVPSCPWTGVLSCLTSACRR